MKRIQEFKIILVLVLMAIVSGCEAGLPFAPTITPTPTHTNTPIPTSTTTSIPIATPSPTSIPTETPTMTVEALHPFGGLLKPGSIVLFSTDFNHGLPPQFSGPADLVDVQGYAGYGTGSNVFDGPFLENGSIPPKATKLNLNDLPAHTSIDIHFLLAIIDSWDGSGPSTCCGPDSLTIMVDGQPVLQAVFDNAWGNGSQTYIPPRDVVLARTVELGFRDIDGHDQESAYDISKDPQFSNIPHTADTLTVEWYASGSNWQGGGDESWAIDNLVIILNTEGQ